LRSGFSFVDPADGRVTPIADPGHDRATTRFNDGRCDRAGRFWAGTMYEPRDRTAAALYRLDAGLSVVRVAGEVIVANGLAFSPDDRIMYWSDSRQAIVWAFDFNLAAGTIANRRVLRRFAPAEGRPDGAAVDAEGFYWSALYDGGRVVRIDPRSGAIVREIALPVRCPTMPAFGGQDLKTIFVTSARHDRPTDELARQPLAGAIFAIDVDVPGLPEPRFAG
jgi:sugar lactone lactonase YvrE